MPIATRNTQALGVALVVAFACVSAAACQRGERATPPSPAPSAAPAASVLAPPLADQLIDIPGGTFQAGSTPGDPGRRPEVEQRLATVELGPFRMDRLPFPNNPAKPSLVGVTREVAEQRCNERGARLCTELEWERACRGPAGSPYATGATWDASCETRGACASGFDVLGLGTLLEWTSSDVRRGDDDGPRGAAIRGAAPGAPGPERRCSARGARDQETGGPGLGFRCCKGARNAAVVKEPTLGVTFTRAEITAARLTEALADDPRTKALATDVRLFREPDAAETVVARGPGDRKGFLFTVAPLLWRPVAGAELLVATGRSGEKTSFVVVFHTLSGGKYRLASSFVMEDETGPVALAYNGYIRPRLHFSTCWGCPGETGKILYRDPEAAVILQP